jgi:hypothetical protein
MLATLTPRTRSHRPALAAWNLRNYGTEGVSKLLFSQTPKDHCLLTVPDLVDADCARFALHVYRAIGASEMEQLEKATDSEARSARVYYQGPEGERGRRTVLTGTAWLDDLSDWSQDERDRTINAFDSPPKGEAARAICVVRFDIQVVPVSFQQPLGDENAFDRIWGFLSQLPDAPGQVTAALRFPADRYECVIGLPLTLPEHLTNFDSIPGLVLVKRDASEPSDGVLYEVAVRQDDGAITANVEFSSPVDGQPDLLNRLVTRARQIARFAIAERPGHSG